LHNQETLQHLKRFSLMTAGQVLRAAPPVLTVEPAVW